MYIVSSGAKCGFCLLESLTPNVKSQEPSFLERLLGNVLKNFEVSITNMHIRYEDWLTKPGVTFAAGITLKEFTIHVRTQCQTNIVGATEVVEIHVECFKNKI